MGSRPSKVGVADGSSMDEHNALLVASLRRQVADSQKELLTLSSTLQQKDKEAKELYLKLQDELRQKEDVIVEHLAKLNDAEARLATLSATNLPTWVASVDGKTSKVYYVNTETQGTTWTKPDDFDGTFVVLDDTSGLVAKVVVSAAVPTTDPAKDNDTEQLQEDTSVSQPVP
eukprot:m.1040451 g.1040451  ORF g.1040451 m.1040451 type:complete len:173 (-) comp24155_c0_seq7:206-724(-)